MKGRWRLLLLLVIPLAFAIYLRGEFAYPVRGDYSDLAISHLPNAEFLRDSLLRGEIPLWSPLLFGGYPFAANPLSGLHYPFGWLVLLFDLPLGFNLVAALHLAAAGLGMFLFLRREDLSSWPALAAAMAFQAMPKLMAHYAAGHLTLFYAVCLTPWLLWSEDRRSESRRQVLRQILPGIFLGLIVLADIRWAPYAALLWLAYALRGWLIQRRNAGASNFLRWLGGLGLAGLVGAILSAPLWLPLLEYIPLTTRAAMTATERIGISLPPANLLGLFIPSMGSYAEWELYAGALLWLLLIFTLAVPTLRRQVWFWLVVLAVSLVAAFGEAIPGYLALSSLPGFSLLRVPTRSLFLCGLAFAALTGFALEYLLQNKVEQKPEPVFFMVPFAAFPLLIAGGMIFYLGGYSLPFLWGGAAMLIGLFAILALERRWLPVGTGLGLLVLLMIIEMIGTDASSIALKKPAEVLDQDTELLARIAPKAGEYYRIYSPSFSLSQAVAAQKGVELVEGIDPMQLKSYVAWFGQASGVPMEGYSVTLPPLENGEPLLDNAGFTPDARLLGLLNTKYVLAAFPLRANDLVWIDQVGEVQIYENMAYRERAWVEEDNGEIGVASILEYRTNRVVLSATGAGTLVLSDVFYPGWQAQVDGKPVAIQLYHNLLRSVALGSGEHQIVFTFRPVLVSIGWGCGLAGWLLILILALRQRRILFNVHQ